MYLRLPAHSPINRHKSKLLIFLLTIAIVAVGLILLLINYLNGNKLFHSFHTKPAAYQLENAFPNLKFNSPVEFVHAGDGTNRIFVLEQEGLIKVFDNNPLVKAASTYMDLKDKVDDGGEMGLLGIAFDPDFKENGYFYVNYNRRNPLETIIARFKAYSYKDSRVSATSETILMRFPQPYDNHNGGKIAFGPDGYLYIAVGDGGAWGDQHNYAQNRSSILGKMLRIDVHKTDKGNYGIPADNPYAGNTEGFREEIYAYGLRNPWRFSFDSKTGQMWVGDVGQNEFEEIDIVTKGSNYGWRLKEASRCYNPRNDCDPSKTLIDPIHQYPRSDGVSVTGGYVYHGKNIPALQGKYLFADYAKGNIWALSFDDMTKTGLELLSSDGGSVSSFGVDANEEIYILDHYSGRIKRLVASK
ncbi:PQQ-dependent sugar dehydrogenase [Emticicia fontis]